MQTIPDSNVVLDVIGRASSWVNWSSRQLSRCFENGGLVVNQVVYAEVASELTSQSALDEVLLRLRIEMESVPFAACFLAGHAHRSYRMHGGKRERVLPDFMIGAHAVNRGYRILTRDASRYRSYFPEVEVIAPDSHP